MPVDLDSTVTSLAKAMGCSRTMVYVALVNLGLGPMGDRLEAVGVLTDEAKALLGERSAAA